MDSRSALGRMMLIRAFEEALMARGDQGFQLYSSGEEAVAVGICEALAPEDQLLCSGRSIGPALARGLGSVAVMAELLGKAGGTNRGRAGRGHMAQPDAGFFGAHAVVGGNLTIAAGAAMAAQREGKGRVVLCLFGDGACGSGALYETMNIASLWRLPLVLVCNNNGFAVSTTPERAIAAAPLSRLAEPFAMPAASIDGMDLDEVTQATTRFVDNARAGKGPAFLECRSERFASHSSATRDTRSKAEVEKVRTRCPIEAYSRKLEGIGALRADDVADLWQQVRSEAERALRETDAMPFPDPEEAFADV